MTNVLNSNKIRADERNVVNLAEHAYDASMINTGDERGEEVR